MRQDERVQVSEVGEVAESGNRVVSEYQSAQR